MVREAPASLAAARLREPDLPAPPMTATTGASYSSTMRLVMAGAPQTSMTARLSALGRSSGMTAAMERPKRTAYPSAGTCSLLPSQPARPSSMTSGVRVRETRVATRSPALRPRGDSGPTSSTVPTSMPPEPVSGFCILPRVSTISRTSRADLVAVVVVLLLQLAEGGGVEVEALDADADLVGPQLLAGVEPLGGLREDDGLVENSVQPGRVAGTHGKAPPQIGEWQDKVRSDFGQTGDPPPTVAQ